MSAFIDWINSLKLESSDIHKRRLQKKVSLLFVIVYYGLFLLIAGFILNTSALYQILSVILTGDLQQYPLLKILLALGLSSMGFYLVKSLPQIWDFSLHINILEAEYSGEEWPGGVSTAILATLYAFLVGGLILGLSQTTANQNLHNAFFKAVSGRGIVSFLVAGIHHLILGSAIVLFFTSLILALHLAYPWQMGFRAWYRRKLLSNLGRIIKLDDNRKILCRQCCSEKYQLYTSGDTERVICDFCGLELENTIIEP